MKNVHDYIRTANDGAPAWFYACMWSVLYLSVAYFIYTSHQFGPYIVIAFLIFSNLYLEGASARQNRRFAIKLSLLSSHHEELKQQYESVTKELREIKELIV